MAKNKRDSIVQAAYDLFREYGYDNSSMKMIAKQANVAQGHIYNFFDSKESLFDEALRMAHDSFWSQMTAAVQACYGAPPEAYIRKCADAIFENREEGNFILLSALMPKLHNRSEPFLKVFSDGMTEMMRPLFPGVPDIFLYDIGNLLLAVSASLLIDGDRERAVRTGVFAVNLYHNYLKDCDPNGGHDPIPSTRPATV